MAWAALRRHISWSLLLAGEVHHLPEMLLGDVHYDQTHDYNNLA